MLFAGIKYFVTPSFPTQRQDELSKILDANGATSADIEEATHVIANTIKFEGMDNVLETARVVTVSSQ